MAQITPNSYQFGTPGLRTGSTIIRSFDNLRLRSTQYGSMEKKGMLLPIHECLIFFMGAMSHAGTYIPYMDFMEYNDTLQCKHKLIII